MARIDIEVLAAVDDAVRALNRVDAAFGDLGGGAGRTELSMKNLKAGWDTATRAFEIGQRVIVGTYDAIMSVIDPTVELANQVRTLARDIGSTPEEASKLISAADDMGISADKLTTALEIAIRKGVRPTVEGLGDLADEYLAIQDPIERTKFLMDKFGRSGADLAPLMERGAAGIEELGDQAERLGLVLDGDALRAAREYELAMDDLDDSVMGLKISLGQELVPAASQVAEMLTTDVTVLSLFSRGLSDGSLSMEEFGKAAALAAIPTRDRLGEAIEYLDRVTEELVDKQRDMVENQVGQWGAEQAVGIRTMGDGASYLGDTMSKAADMTDDLQRAQDAWTQGAADDAVSALRDAGVEGQNYVLALEAIDRVLGTGEANQLAATEHIQALTDEFLRTGDVETYETAIQRFYTHTMDGFTKSFERTHGPIATTNAGMAEMAGRLDGLNGKRVDIEIVTKHIDVYEQQGAPGVPKSYVPPGAF